VWGTNTNDVYLSNNGNVGIGTSITGGAALSVMNGNVGIGTWVPGSALQVNNTITFKQEYCNNSCIADASNFNIDWNTANKQKIILGAGGLTASFTNPTSGVGNFLLKIVQDNTGSRTISTWTPSSGTIKWSGGAPPILTTTANKTDIVSCYYDGTDYYCTASLNF